MLNKKVFLLLVLPSIVFNYFTLLLLDHDHSLSLFSSLTITTLNIINILLSYIFSKYGLIKFIKVFFPILIIFILIDISIENFKKKNKFQIYDKNFGWILNKSLNLKTTGYTKQKKKYKVDYYTSEVLGFREFSKDKRYKNNILIIGDSFTAGPFASNSKMYYSYLKEGLEKKNYFFNWYVSGAGGYGSLQQYLFLKENIDIIKPNIFIHQFCENNFENNSKVIGKNSVLRHQYFFRPYLVNQKVVYDNSWVGSIYRFFYRNSFFLKKIEKIISSYQYKKNEGYYDKEVYDQFFIEAKDTTQEIFNMIRGLIGEDVIYISINCSSKNKIKTKYWKEILKKINAYSIIEPIELTEKLFKDGNDIYYMDGAHLNDYGNEIYGKELTKNILELFEKINFKSISN